VAIDDVRAGLDKDPQQVAAMFDAVARRYDLANDVMTAGQVRRWRRVVVEALALTPGQVVLDLAAGTGTSSLPIREAGARVVPCDFSAGMLAVGKAAVPSLPFVAGDAFALPFADDAFDAVTISFGLRNLHDLHAGLTEMRRVTRPGGRLVVCEVSHPPTPLARKVYDDHLLGVLPLLVRGFASAPAAYQYLAESMRAWPDQPALAATMAQAGWQAVEWRNLAGGLVAVHRARA
jgi:demethylmenaquinone methyltransferase/2-methoxy-6-polyprenyl-1,4-benzoquinol methylase